MKKVFIFLALFIGLTGCVRYDVGVTFPQANSGTIIQHIKLSEQLTNFSDSEGDSWLKTIASNAMKLQGKAKYFSPTELVVTIPFSNGSDLVDKFNQFFSNEMVSNSDDNLLNLSAEMSIKQNNLLFLERNALNLTADLTPLGVISTEGNLIISSGDLVDIQIQFNFPWGAKLTTNQFPKWERLEDNSYNIRLKAGQNNEVTAIFWLPNYIGVGTSAIALFIIFGYLLKYQKLPLV